MKIKCPCGAEAAYEDCCGRFHAGPTHLAAPDAHLLMRSRYCAFAMQLRQYLLDTWHASTRPSDLDLDTVGLKWIGLDVKRFEPDGPDHAIVEFVARSKLGGRARRMHEISRFVKEHGRWFYLDGTDPDRPHRR